MHKITAKQCRTARSLLKWNVYDLSTRVKDIPPKRIESFERGTVHILEWEIEQLVTVLTKAGIVFRPDLEVELKKGAEYIRQQDLNTVRGDGARIVLDADMTVISDSSTDRKPLIFKPEDQEKKEIED